MKTFIKLYDDIKQVVSFFSKQLRFDKYKNKLGRKLALAIEDVISLAIFKQKNHIATKKSLYGIFKPDCSYKTLVVNLNRWYFLALIILALVMEVNKKNSHLVKHTDSTDIPVCSDRKARYHQTMKGLANWGYTGKGAFFGLKLHITCDLERKLLAIKFTSGNIDDREVFIKLNDDLLGWFVTDAGCVSEKLAQDFYIEHKRILLATPRKNMRKLMTKFQAWLQSTRMIIELNFRSLKCFYGLITSLPRSVDGYLANYIYSLLAYQIA